MRVFASALFSYLMVGVFSFAFEVESSESSYQPSLKNLSALEQGIAQPMALQESRSFVEVAGPVSLDLKKSGKKWTKGREENFGGQGLVEFQLEGEEPESWSEVVTVQYFSGVSLPAREFFDLFIEELKKEAGDEAVSSRVMTDKPDDLFAEWSMKGTGKDQHEWLRIMKNGKKTAVVRYSTKNLKEVASSGAIWEEILRQATFN